jgi:predicted metal-binding membrane protein
VPDSHDPVGRWLYGGTLVGLIGGAWAALGLLGASAYAPYFSHAFEWGDEPWPVAARVAVFVAGWVLMSVAMMLPSSLPLVTVFHTITRPAWWLVVLLIAGYLGIWALFGLVASLADGLIVHALVEAVPWLTERAHLISAAVLLTAGLFQFSPLKYSCLTQCRSPVGFVVQHWRGGARALRAFSLGVRHGVFCVGCCWAVMLLMFGVGGINLGWMLALGAIMFVEKAVDWGLWITAPLGGVLSLWGLALLLKVPGVPHPF